MVDPRIVKIEWAPLEGARPREAGCSAGLGEHGSRVRVPMLRLTTEDGATGFGRAGAHPEEAAPLLGRRLGACFTEGAVDTPWRALEYPLWDLAARRLGEPVYR